MIQVLHLSNPRFHFLGYFGRSSKIQSGGQNAFLWTRGLGHALVRRWQWILLRQMQTMFTHVYVDSETRHNLQNEPKRIKIGHPGNPSPRSIEGFGRILNGQPFEDAGSNNRATFPATINCASFINNTTMPASWQLNMCMLHLVKTNAVLVYMCFCESSCRRYCSSVLLQATKNSAACQPLNTSEIYAVNWHQFRGVCAALIYRVASMKLQMYSVHVVISPTNKSNWALQNSHITRYHVWFARPRRAEIHRRSHPLVGIRCYLYGTSVT